MDCVGNVGNVLTLVLPLENVLTPLLHPLLPRRKADRLVNGKYMCNGRVVVWNGKKLKCIHLKNVAECSDCGGSQICEHKRLRQMCKGCNGIGICEHGKRRSICIPCGGTSLCEHKIQKDRCKSCVGSQICEHNKVRQVCRECGGAAYCEHDKLKHRCVSCHGTSICEHKKRRSQCKICSPGQYLSYIIRKRIWDAMKNYSEKKKKHSMEYLGCSIEKLREHLEKQFTAGMSWENQGAWHADHVRPCSSFNLETEEEKHKCFHYTNLQPLWATENISKNDKYDEATFPWKWVVDHWEPK